MYATVLHDPGDIRDEQVEKPRILAPTDAIIRLSATCICGSDLWPYRGIAPNEKAKEMGHDYCGTVIKVGSEVRNIRPGQWSDNTCPHCEFGFQSSCMQRVLDGRIQPGRVFDLVLPTDQAAKGYKAMDESRAIKTVLTV